MEKTLEDQELYNDKIKLQEILDKHAQIKTQLEGTEAEWLENLEKLEQLNN